MHLHLLFNFVVFFCLLTTACSNKSPAPQETAMPVAHLNFIDDSYSKKIISKYQKKTRRILNALISNKCYSKNSDPQLKIFLSNEPQAFSSRSTIYLSQKLLKSFESDGELLFIYAHELSHILKCHHLNYDKSKVTAYELEADLLAARTIRLLGFDLKVAYSALNKLYSQNKPGFHLKNYPTIAERIKNLNRLNK